MAIQSYSRTPRSYLQLGPKVTAILTTNCRDATAPSPTHLPLPPNQIKSLQAFPFPNGSPLGLRPDSHPNSSHTLLLIYPLKTSEAFHSAGTLCRSASWHNSRNSRKWHPLLGHHHVAQGQTDPFFCLNTVCKALQKVAAAFRSLLQHSAISLRQQNERITHGIIQEEAEIPECNSGIGKTWWLLPESCHAAEGQSDPFCFPNTACTAIQGLEVSNQIKRIYLKMTKNISVTYNFYKIGWKHEEDFT